MAKFEDFVDVARSAPIGEILKIRLDEGSRNNILLTKMQYLEAITDIMETGQKKASRKAKHPKTNPGR